MIIRQDDISRLIPQQPPFRMVDEIRDLVPWQSAIGYKYVGANEPFFVGHFPGNPIMPGVLQVEAMAQTGWGLIAKSFESSGKVIPDIGLLASIDSTKFRKPILPGCTLEMRVEIKRIIGNIASFDGKMYVNGELVSEIQFKAGMMYSNQYTLAIIKPDAVRNRVAGEIQELIEANNLKIASIERDGVVSLLRKTIRLTYNQAAEFYSVHKDRPFFKSLCKFMSSGESVVMVLKGEDAIAQYRKVMGATDPSQAGPGTIRQRYASSIDENAVHGSDSPEAAKTEITFFFPEFAVP